MKSLWNAAQNILGKFVGLAHSFSRALVLRVRSGKRARNALAIILSFSINVVWKGRTKRSFLIFTVFYYVF